jgi:NADH-quinone oxidoreductase subunit N
LDVVLYFFLLVSFLSLFIGNFGALYELKVKRFVVYSSIANIGLLLLGFFIFNFEGLQLIFFFMFFYSLMLFLFFNIFLVVRVYFKNSFLSVIKYFGNNFTSIYAIKVKYFEDFIPLFFANPLLVWL